MNIFCDYCYLLLRHRYTFYFENQIQFLVKNSQGLGLVQKAHSYDFYYVFNTHNFKGWTKK